MEVFVLLLDLAWENVIFHEGDNFLTQVLWQEQVLLTHELLSSPCPILCCFVLFISWGLFLHYIIFLYRIPPPQVSNFMLLYSRNIHK